MVINLLAASSRILTDESFRNTTLAESPESILRLPPLRWRASPLKSACDIPYKF